MPQSPGCVVRLVALALVLGLLATAPDPARAVPLNPRFENLSVEQGLPQETVVAILQDRQGFMWFGTQSGLGRYDGQRFVVFRNDPSDPGSLADNWAGALMEDPEGRLWVGTGGGLQRFDAAQGTFVRTESAAREAENRDVRQLLGEFGAPGDFIWAATASGLDRLDSKSGAVRTWRHAPERAESLASDDVWALARDTDGALWVGTAVGLDRYVAATDRFEHFRIDESAAPDPKHNDVQVLFAEADRSLWIGTLAGLEVWTLGSEPIRRRRFGAADGLPPGEIQSIARDAEGNLWVGTRRAGLYRWDAREQTFIAYRHVPQDRNSLGADEVVSIYADRSGVLWFGTWNGGVSRLDLTSGGFERHVSVAGDPRTISEPRIYGIAGDGHGGLWLSTVGGGLDHFDPDVGVDRGYRHDPADPSSLPDDRVYAVAVRDDGRAWVGTASGVAAFDAGSGRFTPMNTFAEHAELARVRELLVDQAGVLWIGSDGGLQRHDPQAATTKTYRHDPARADSLSAGRVRTILQDRRGALWIGTDSGVDRLDLATETFAHFRHEAGNPDSLSQDRVADLFEDRGGTIWVGTAGGLNRMTLDADGAPSFRNYTLRDGLESDGIGATLDDAAGRIWFSSNAGLSRLDPATGSVRNYNARDGLITGSYYIGSAHASAAGVLYFGGIKGMTAFRPESIRDNTVPPPVTITALKVSNRAVLGDQRPEGVEFAGPIAGTRALRLGPNVSVFSLEFAALHFADPARNRFAHRLVGFESDWVHSGAAEGSATYTNLAPGEYEFQVKASNKDGVWNETGATLAITILPPWWATWWFRTAVVALVVGSAFTAYRYRVRGLKHQRERLQDEVQLRTAEIERQKEQLEAGQRDLGVLGEIGREVTATLDPRAVIETLDRHVHALLDAAAFGIYLMDDDGRGLTSALLVEDGKPGPVDRIDLASATRIGARCVRERREIVVDFPPDAENPSHVPGTMRTLSALFAPLVVGEHALGMMTIQSPRREAYGEREQQVFRTLCSYAAIALDNAAAYRRLADTDATLQRTLREQEVIFDNAAAAIFFVKDRVIHRCNRGMEDVLGYGPGELLGQSTQIYHPSHDSWARQGQAMYPKIAAGQVADGEWEIVRKDGTPIWIAYRGRAVDPQDVAQGTVWIATDVTERKRTEAALERALREQQVLFDNVQGGILFAKDRLIARCNRGMEVLLGYEPGELIGQHVRVLFASDEAVEENARLVRPMLMAGQVAKGEIEYRRKDGAPIWVVYSGKALDPSDLAQGIVWVSHDIQALKETEAALQAVLLEQQLIWDNLQGVVVTRDRIVVRCSRGAEEILGFAPGMLQGQSARVYFKSDEAYEEFGRRVYPMLASGAVAQTEAEHKRTDGSLIQVFVSGKAIDASDLSKGVVWVAQDINLQKRNEAALERALLEQQLVFDNIAGSIVIARDGVIHRCNRGFEQMLGFRSGEAIGQPVSVGYVSQDAWKAFAKRTAPDILAGKAVTGEGEYRHRDGTLRWMLYQGKAIDPRDIAQGTIWFGQDITERKHSETLLLETKERLEQGLAEVEHLNRQVTLLGELTGFLQACPNADDAYACIGQFGPRLFPRSAGALYLAEQTGGAWVAHGSWGAAVDGARGSGPRSIGPLSIGTGAGFQSNDCWALRRSRPYRVDDPAQALCCPHVLAGPGKCHPYVCVPLTAQGKTFGLLSVEHQDVAGGDEAERRHGLAVSMAEQIALAISNLQLREALLQQSIRDPLTGLYNRRHMQEALFREIGRSRRTEGTMALMMIDVDHFKRFNDTFGHAAGDIVLQQVARSIEAQVRRGDIACRFGGEEFAVLVPGATLDLAQKLANGVLDGVRMLQLSHDGRALDRITASLGVALFPIHAHTPEALIEAADQALYRAKDAGRNRVVACAAGQG